MTENIRTAEEHPDDVEAVIEEPEFDDSEPVEADDSELDGIDFDEIDAEDVPVLEVEEGEEA